MLLECNEKGISIGLLDDLAECDDTTLVEYVNAITRELSQTRSEQVRLNERVDQLSSEINKIKNRFGRMTQQHDQLHGKVQSLTKEHGQTRAISKKAVEIAEASSREVKALREETAAMFQKVREEFVGIGKRLDQLLENI